MFKKAMMCVIALLVIHIHAAESQSEDERLKREADGAVRVYMESLMSYPPRLDSGWVEGCAPQLKNAIEACKRASRLTQDTTEPVEESKV